MNRFVLPIVALFCAASASADLTLVDNGRPRALIVLPDEPSPAARRALSMLQSHLQQITGTMLPTLPESKVAGEPTEQQPFVLLGESALAHQLGFSTEGMGPGGMHAEARAHVLALLGTDNQTTSDYWGTLYATVRFLEQIGVRYLWPGELGKVVPHSPTLTVADFKSRITPQLTQRHIRTSGYNPRAQVGLDHLRLTREEFDASLRDSVKTTADTCDWFQWQGLGGTMNISGGHAFGSLWAKYGKDHPEWFALQSDGTRGDGSRLCKSNRDLIAEIARLKIEELDNNPELLGVSLSPNDGSRGATFCTCSNCEALDVPTDRKVKLWDFSGKQTRYFDHVPLTDRMVWFWDAIAEQVVKVHPDKLLTVDAYSVYASPPIERKLHPSLVVRFAALEYHSEAERQQALRDWDGWAKAASHIYYRSNFLLAGRRNGLPLVYVHRFAEDFRHFAATGMIGTDLDSCMANWATQGLNYYVVSRLHFDPQQNVDALIDDYCRAGFGPAAPTMRHYFDDLESVFTHAAQIGEPHGEVAGFSDEVLTHLRLILDKARSETASTPDACKRVEFVGLGLKWTEIEVQAQQLLAASQKPDAATVKRVLDERMALMRELFKTAPLALNVAAISWGEDASLARLGYVPSP